MKEFKLHHMTYYADINTNNILIFRGDMSVANLNLKSFDELPWYEYNWEIDGSFSCAYNNLRNLHFGPSYVSNNFICTDNKLISLSGAPRKIGGNFCCNDNKLSSFIGGPEYVGGTFICDDNKITSLDGSPKHIEGHYYVHSENIKCLRGAPEYISEDGFYCSNFSVEDYKKYIQQLKLDRL